MAYAAAGGSVASPPAGAARNADAALVVVVNADQAEAALFGDNGAVSTLPREAVVIVSVTMAPDRAKAIGYRLSQHGVHMLDAPVSGGIKRAAAGTLTIMASGPSEARTRAEPFCGRSAAICSTWVPIMARVPRSRS